MRNATVEQPNGAGYARRLSATKRKSKLEGTLFREEEKQCGIGKT
jgi:hypothetical protein